MPASLLTALPPFGPLPDQTHFLAAWETRTVAEGEFLSEAGAVCQELFFVQRGVLRIVGRSVRGKEITHSFRQEGQLCTLFTSFDQQVPTPYRIQAACPARVLVISKTRLAALYEQLPSLAAVFTRFTQQQLAEKLQLHRAYLGQDAAARYQTLLAHQPAVARRVPQHMLASYLGITPPVAQPPA